MVLQFRPQVFVFVVDQADCLPKNETRNYCSDCILASHLLHAGLLTQLYATHMSMSGDWTHCLIAQQDSEPHTGDQLPMYMIRYLIVYRMMQMKTAFAVFWCSILDTADSFLPFLPPSCHDDFANQTEYLLQGKRHHILRALYEGGRECL